VQPDDSITFVNAFGLALFGDCLRREPSRTVLLSPYTAAVSLIVAAQGARGKTSDAFVRVLGLETLTEEEAALKQGALIQALRSPGGDADLSVASGIWVQRSVTPDPAFVELQETAFGVKVAGVDFADPDALSGINRWISDETRGNIPALISGLDPATMLVIASALHFKGVWQTAFDPDATVQRRFHLPDGGTRDVAMMQLTSGSIRYREESGFQAVELPYRGGNFSMELVLPASTGNGRAGNGKAAPLPRNEDLANLLDAGGFVERPGTVMIPRIILETRSDLRPSLQALGLESAFYPGADFSGIGGGMPPLDQVLQGVALKVDEAGTEAASATAIIATRSLIRDEHPFTVMFDRPFFILLRHIRSAVTLLMGYVTDPSGG
jgi:serine protease inhibitor